MTRLLLAAVAAGLLAAPAASPAWAQDETIGTAGGSTQPQGQAPGDAPPVQTAPISLPGGPDHGAAPDAAAGAPAGGPAGPGEAEGPRPATRMAQVFISPSGEPFHAAWGQPYPAADWFARADADHDGAITAAEFAADAKAFFKRLDANGDGRVDGFENGDYETKVAPEIQPRIGGLQAGDVMTRRERLGPGADPNMRAPGGRMALPSSLPKFKKQPMRKGAGAFSWFDEPQPIRAADLNLDFKVSTEEWDRATARRFAALDKNKDGRLTKDELPFTPVEAMQIEADLRAKKK